MNEDLKKCVEETHRAMSQWSDLTYTSTVPSLLSRVLLNQIAIMKTLDEIKEGQIRSPQFT